MEGVKIIQEAYSNKRYAQIDIEVLAQKGPVELRELVDSILAESRQTEETFTPDEIEAHLNSVGKH